ncbi:MAG TPA: type II toxin-antitoxin system RelE/ParE family toxin [Propionibacteriaceae bacterium]
MAALGDEPMEVVWSTPARRDLSRLPPRIASVILTYVDERLATNPARMSKPLTGALQDLRSARSGDYRVLLRLVEAERRVVIIRVDHRAHVYRRG